MCQLSYPTEATILTVQQDVCPFLKASSGLLPRLIEKPRGPDNRWHRMMSDYEVTLINDNSQYPIDLGPGGGQLESPCIHLDAC
jgi:hypothetical protein